MLCTFPAVPLKIVHYVLCDVPFFIYHAYLFSLLYWFSKIAVNCCSIKLPCFYLAYYNMGKYGHLTTITAIC